MKVTAEDEIYSSPTGPGLKVTDQGSGKGNVKRYDRKVRVSVLWLNAEVSCLMSGV